MGKKPDNMRQAFKANTAKAQSTIINIEEPTAETSVTTTVEQLENNTEEKPKKTKTPRSATVKETKTEFKLPEGFKLEIKSKEKRTVPKSFMLTESINKKFSEMAEECGVSENELLNTILGQIFSMDS